MPAMPAWRIPKHTNIGQGPTHSSTSPAKKFSRIWPMLFEPKTATCRFPAPWPFSSLAYSATIASASTSQMATLSQTHLLGLCETQGCKRAAALTRGC